MKNPTAELFPIEKMRGGQDALDQLVAKLKELGVIEGDGSGEPLPPFDADVIRECPASTENE